MSIPPVRARSPMVTPRVGRRRSDGQQSRSRTGGPCRARDTSRVLVYRVPAAWRARMAMRRRYERVLLKVSGGGAAVTETETMARQAAARCQEPRACVRTLRRNKPGRVLAAREEPFVGGEAA